MSTSKNPSLRKSPNSLKKKLSTPQSQRSESTLRKMHAMITELLQKETIHQEQNYKNFKEKEFASPPSLNPKQPPKEQKEIQNPLAFTYNDEKNFQKKIQSEKKDQVNLKDMPLMSYSFTTEGAYNSKPPRRNEENYDDYLSPDYLSHYNITPLATPKKVESLHISDNNPNTKKIPLENFFDFKNSQPGECISRWFNLDLNSKRKSVESPKRSKSPLKIKKKKKESFEFDSSYLTQKLKIESYNMPNLKIAESSKNVKVEKGLNFSSLENEGEHNPGISGLTLEINNQHNVSEEKIIEKSGIENLKKMMQKASSVEKEYISFQDHSFKTGKKNFDNSPDRVKRKKDTPKKRGKRREREFSTTAEKGQNFELYSERKVTLTKFNALSSTRKRTGSSRKREKHFFNLVFENSKKKKINLDSEENIGNPLRFNLAEKMEKSDLGGGEKEVIRFETERHNLYANKECFVFSFMGDQILTSKNSVFTMGIKVNKSFLNFEKFCIFYFSVFFF